MVKEYMCPKLNKCNKDLKAFKRRKEKASKPPLELVIRMVTTEDLQVMQAISVCHGPKEEATTSSWPS